MPAFIDVTCKHCGRRFGWQGEITGPAPPCPGCGKHGSEDKDPEPVLGPQPMTGEGFFKARRFSKIGFGNAAMLLKISQEQLEDFEEGRVQPGAEVMQRMAILYQVAFVNEQHGGQDGA